MYPGRGDERDCLLRHCLMLFVCKRIEQCLAIGNKGRRNILLLHVRSLKQCLEGLVHRLSSIEKDAHVSFWLCQYEQAKEYAERLLCGSRRLQSGYLQSQDGDYTPHSRNLLGAAEQCCKPLQGKWISLLRQIDARQRQIGDFAAVEECILTVGGVLS